MSFEFPAIKSTLGGVFRRTMNTMYYPALIAGIHPRFPSQAYLVSIRHSTFQVSGYRVYPRISEVSVSSLPCISYFHLLFQRQEGGVLFFVACEGVSLLLTLFFICTLPCHIWTYLLLSFFSLDYVSFLSLCYTTIQQSYKLTCCVRLLISVSPLAPTVSAGFQFVRANCLPKSIQELQNMVLT